MNPVKKENSGLNKPANKAAFRGIKTFSAKPSDVKREWYLIDASESTLGRMSTKIASLLIGKEKPIFTSHIDCGDFVVVINSDKLKVSGSKVDNKKYYRHSSYPGSLKETTLKNKLESDSNDVIYHSVRGMLPKNKLIGERLKRLKIYKGMEHNHEAQKPTKVSIK